VPANVAQSSHTNENWYFQRGMDVG